MATKKVKTKTTKTETITQPTVAAALIAPEELQRLRKMNIWLALVFAVQAVVVVLFGGSKTAPIVMQYLSVDQLSSEINGHQVLGVASRHLFDVRFTAVAAAFLVLFALTCLVMATVGRAQYETRLLRGTNLARWLAFGLGGGLMVVAIALESGVYSLATLILVFVAMMLGASLEPLAEKLKGETKGGTILPHAVCAAALTAGALPWVVFALGMLGAMLWGGHIPGNVYMMYVTTLVLFGCWTLASHFRITKRGKWVDVLYAEKMYMFLGLASATVLAWQIFAGAI
jgi:hypothetical protein